MRILNDDKYDKILEIIKRQQQDIDNLERVLHMTNIKLNYAEDKLAGLVKYLPDSVTKEKIEALDEHLLAEYDKKMASFRPNYKALSKED